MFAIGSIVLFIGLSCPEAVIINHTDSWTKMDQINYKAALKGCKRVWPEYPCLTKFVKKENLVYNVHCGVKR